MTIFKYEIAIRDEQAISLPEGAKILTVQTQYGIPNMWVLVDPKAPNKTRHFRLFGTGHPFDLGGNTQYIGSFLIDEDTLVFHLFEVIK